MKFTAQQIATLVQGVIEGDPQVKVQSFSKIEESREGDLCFLANLKYEDYLYTSKASVVIVNENLVLRQSVQPVLIRVKDAYAAFAMLLQTYESLVAEKPRQGIEARSMVAENAKIDYLVTRNIKDFKRTKIKIVTPKQFLSLGYGA